jgi:hypothetical protein
MPWHVACISWRPGFGLVSSLKKKAVNQDTQLVRLATATTLFLIEIAVIAVIYQFLVDFDCAKTDYYAACRGLRSGIVRAGVILVVLVFYLLKRRELLETLLDAARVHIGNRLYLLANIAGFATVFLPLLIFTERDGRKCDPCSFDHCGWRCSHGFRIDELVPALARLA